MTLRGETLATGAPWECPDCGLRVALKVLRSNAGYYVGSDCATVTCFGPYTRESGYYPTQESAQEALDSGNYSRP